MNFNLGSLNFPGVNIPDISGQINAKVSEARAKANEIVGNIRTEVNNEHGDALAEANAKIAELKGKAVEKIDEVKTEATGKVDELKGKAEQKIAEVKQMATDSFNEGGLDESILGRDLDIDNTLQSMLDERKANLEGILSDLKSKLPGLNKQ